MSGPIEAAIKAKLQAAFQPTHLEVLNESHTHNVPKNSETHFRVHIVSSKFENQSRIQRQRLVHETLKDELQPGRIHALTQRAMTPEEWDEQNQVIETNSPPCFGGSKREKI